MEQYIELKNSIAGESIVVRISDPMLFDRLVSLSAEYSVPTELLVNVAIKKLIEDVDLVRKLRAGGSK